MPNDADRYRLGKSCTLTVEGRLVRSVTSLTLRRIVREVDATGFGHEMTSTLVTHRTHELELELLEPSEIHRLRDAEQRGRVVTVTTANGTRSVSANFTIHESNAEEPLDDACRARFTLKQWGHPK